MVGIRPVAQLVSNRFNRGNTLREIEGRNESGRSTKMWIIGSTHVNIVGLIE